MIVGIDLGTTNSAVAYWADGTARIIPNSLGHRLTPSVVGLDDDGGILVGLPARERLVTHPFLTAAAFKRYMGTDRIIPLGKRGFRPEELSSFVLRALKSDAEACLGEQVTEAVITVPAYFNDRQRKATKIAGQLAGLTVERLLNEPTAAALAYGLHNREAESKFIVLDLGGGTYDVSLLEVFEGIMEVRAAAGDNFLGGEDFVDVLVKAFARHAAEMVGEDPLGSDVKLSKRVRVEAERAKRQMSEEGAATMTVRIGQEEVSWRIDEESFRSLSARLLERLTSPVERALRDARIRSPEINEVLLVGGATRMPIVRKLVARMFGRFPSTHLNPDETVASGAALQAGLKARDRALKDVVLTDVCPYTLGVEVVRDLGSRNYQPGYFHPIIERNTVVPSSRVDTLSSIHDQQMEIDLKIYQGESRTVKENIFLGAIRIAVPPGPAGKEKVDVRFTYDINGLLEVEATVLTTGRKKRLVIEQSPGVMSPEEIEGRLRSLAALKIHPRDQTENKATLTRAERLYEQLTGEPRQFLADQIAVFESVLARQNPREVDEVRRQMDDLLTQIEGDTYL